MKRRSLLTLQLVALLGGCNATAGHGIQGEPHGYTMDGQNAHQSIHFDGLGHVDRIDEYADGKITSRAPDGHIIKITPLPNVPTIFP